MTFVRNRRNSMLLVIAIVATLAGGVAAVFRAPPARAASQTCGSPVGLYSFRITLTNQANQSVTLKGIRNVAVAHDQKGIVAKLSADQFAAATSAFGDKMPIDALTFTKLFETTATGLKHETFLAHLVGKTLQSANVMILNGTTVVDDWEVQPAYVEYVTSTEPAAGQTSLPSQKIGIAASKLIRLGTPKIAAPAPHVSATGWAYKDTIKYTNTTGNPATRAIIPSHMTIDQDSQDAQDSVAADQGADYQDDAGAPPTASVSMTVPYTTTDNASDGVFAYSFDEPSADQPTSDSIAILNDGQTATSYTTTDPAITTVTLNFPSAGACPTHTHPNWTMQTIVKALN